MMLQVFAHHNHHTAVQCRCAKPLYSQLAGCRKERAIEILEYTKLCKENYELERQVAELERKAQISTIGSSTASRGAGGSRAASSTRTL